MKAKTYRLLTLEEADTLYLCEAPLQFQIVQLGGYWRDAKGLYHRPSQMTNSWKGFGWASMWQVEVQEEEDESEEETVPLHGGT